jgi:hypothetical protein
MRVLSFIVFCLLLVFSDRQPGSPHGSDFKISCSACHTPEGWQFNKAGYTFDHNTTKMSLIGQHAEIDCKQCHTTLVFSEAKTECNACHNDVHQATVSLECSRCHTPASWLVDNVNDIHQMGRFPLLGAHRTADCIQCHKSESLVRFDVLGVECIDCHRENYMSTTNPNHIESGFSEDCAYCHPVNSFQWEGAGFNHNFFPLVQAHSVPACVDCHTTGNYTDASQECYSCHQTDYTAATNPNHLSSGFPTTCQECHTLNPGWKPATFDHNIFPLTLGHSVPACIDCHINGNYASTPTDCYACHQSDYTGTTNPNHQSSGFSVACTECHTTNPGWKPTSFDHSRFPLTQGHSGPACIDCHTNGNYSSTPTDCYACHQSDYNGTTNPNHQSLAFSVTCTACHTTAPGWKPASYRQHDSQSFPIYSGRHNGQWNTCTDCHTDPSNYAQFSCITCHEHNKTDMDNRHQGENGYSYNSSECLRCHPTGNAD